MTGVTGSAYWPGQKAFPAEEKDANKKPTNLDDIVISRASLAVKGGCAGAGKINSQ